MIKTEFDKRFAGSWHVFVGKHFGAYVTHEAKHLIYFNMARQHSSSSSMAS